MSSNKTTSNLALNAPITEDEYSRTYGLRDSNEREFALQALEHSSYGEHGFWHDRDTFASDTSREIGCMMQGVTDVVFAAENGFEGGLELACFDIFGENWMEAHSMIIDLYHLESRDGALVMSPVLALLLVKPLLVDWKAHAEEPLQTDIVQMVRDALAGRWDIPDDILLPAIARALQEVTLVD